MGDDRTIIRLDEGHVEQHLEVKLDFDVIGEAEGNYDHLPQDNGGQTGSVDDQQTQGVLKGDTESDAAFYECDETERRHAHLRWNVQHANTYMTHKYVGNCNTSIALDKF